MVRLGTVGEVAQNQLAAGAAAEAHVLRAALHNPPPPATLQRLGLVLLDALRHLGEGEGGHRGNIVDIIYIGSDRGRAYRASILYHDILHITNDLGDSQCA